MTENPQATEVMTHNGNQPGETPAYDQLAARFAADRDVDVAQVLASHPPTAAELLADHPRSRP